MKRSTAIALILASTMVVYLYGCDAATSPTKEVIVQADNPATSKIDPVIGLVPTGPSVLQQRLAAAESMVRALEDLNTPATPYASVAATVLGLLGSGAGWVGMRLAKRKNIDKLASQTALAEVVGSIEKVKVAGKVDFTDPNTKNTLRSLQSNATMALVDKIQADRAA